jgi:hypothetical protein
MNFLELKNLRQRTLSETRLYGGGSSLLRTRLHPNFPVNLGKYREYCDFLA